VVLHWSQKYSQMTKQELRRGSSCPAMKQAHEEPPYSDVLFNSFPFYDDNCVRVSVCVSSFIAFKSIDGLS
jgi:hypothetical protein